MLKYILIVLFVLSSFKCESAAVSASDSSKLYSVVQLKSDMVFLKNVLEKAHPSLYRYIPKDSLNGCFNQAYSNLDHPISKIEFWEILQNLVVKIGSGHTSMLLDEVFINHSYELSRQILPFQVFIRANKVFVKGYVSGIDTAFRFGDEILSINGIAASQILSRERNMFPGDGYTNTFKDYHLENGAFGGFYYLLNGDQPEFKVVLKSGSAVKQKTVKATFVQGRNSAIRDTKPVKSNAYSGPVENNEADNIHSLVYPADMPHTAVLKFRDFEYDDYKSFHKQVFDELLKNGVKNLVLDLRNNEGGQDNVCIDLMKYLVNKEFRFLARSEAVINVNKFSAAINGGGKSVVNLTSFDHKLNEVKDGANSLNKPYKKRFDGDVYILTNGGTFSAAALLAVALKNQMECTILGQETGGGLAGCDGGTIVKIVLPNTLFQLELPLVWGYTMTNDQNTGHGLKPDIELIPDVIKLYNQVYKKIDPELSYLRGYIQQRALQTNHK